MKAYSITLTAVVLVVLVCAIDCGIAISGIALAAVVPLGLRDASLKKTKALSNGAGSVATDGIDLEVGPRGDHLANCELLITAPALTATQLPNDETMTYSIEHDTASDFGSVATLIPAAVIQAGAGGSGAPSTTRRVRLPAGVNRHVRVKATKTGTGDASTVSMAVEYLF